MGFSLTLISTITGECFTAGESLETHVSAHSELLFLNANNGLKLHCCLSVGSPLACVRSSY